MKDLEIEVARMWGLETETVLVVVGALGPIKKGLENRMQKISGNIRVEDLQKISVLGTAHILRNVLSMK